MGENKDISELLNEDLEVVAELGVPGARPFVIDGGRAVGIEVGGREPQNVTTVGEKGALMLGAQFDEHVGRQVDDHKCA